MATTAVAGSLAVDTDSAWYRGLSRPAWQPRGPVFGAVWTPLYASLAWSVPRALDRTIYGRDRRRTAAAFGVNLVLNAGWNVLFFRAHRPVAATVGAGLLALSSGDLARRAHRSDPVAGAALVPYAAWCAFAAALTARIAQRNR